MIMQAMTLNQVSKSKVKGKESYVQANYFFLSAQFGSYFAQTVHM